MTAASPETFFLWRTDDDCDSIVATERGLWSHLSGDHDYRWVTDASGNLMLDLR